MKDKVMKGLKINLTTITKFNVLSRELIMRCALLSFAMLLGRLEIFTLLVLFTPTFWRQ